MLRARTNTGLFILGLDAENVRRLQAGQPIMVSLGQMGGTDDVMICYGKTLPELAAKLETQLGPLPEPTPLRRDA